MSMRESKDIVESREGARSLGYAGEWIMLIGWIGLVASIILCIVMESGFPILLGIVSLFSCWLSSLIFKGIANIIYLLIDIKLK